MTLEKIESNLLFEKQLWDCEVSDPRNVSPDNYFFSGKEQLKFCSIENQFF